MICLTLHVYVTLLCIFLIFDSNSKHMQSHACTLSILVASVPFVYCNFSSTVSDPVQNLMLSVQSATSISVSWTAPEAANGLISAYIIEYESITPGIDHQVTTSVASNAQAITLTGLQEHTTYSVAVRVRNGAGESPNVKETAKTLEAGACLVESLKCL